MRFSEFKIVKEAPEQNKFYTIGDSHAVAVAQAGGKEWINLAIGGRSSTDQEMLANINKIPKGAVVLVSQGANDTANAARAHIDSQGKRPLKPAQSIAASVANVVDQVQAKGATVIFLLFPNGPGRGTGLAKYYGGDYQEEVRTAIKSAIGSVPVIDLNGKPLTDGVHATMGSYREVANKVKTEHGQGITLGPSGANPEKIPTKDKPSSSELKKGPPFPIEDRKAVSELQKKLSDLGYSVGPTGVDGKYGPYTAAAVTAFKNDYKLTGDGNLFAQADQETLGKVVSGEIAQVEKPTKVVSGSAEGGVGATGSAKEAVEFFVGKGWTAEQSAGIVGNLQAESGANLKTDAVGDGGLAYGIAQWHPDRQRKFERAFGKNIRGSSFKEQLAFVQWELDNTETKAAGYLKRAKTAEEAAWAFDEYYERSSGAHRQRRINNALALANQTTQVA